MTAFEVRQHTRPCGNCSRPVGDLPPGWIHCCWNPIGCNCLDGAAAPAVPPISAERAAAGLRYKTATLRALCASRQTSDGHGGQTDAEPIWPSEILAILDAQPLR